MPKIEDMKNHYLGPNVSFIIETTYYCCLVHWGMSREWAIPSNLLILGKKNNSFYFIIFVLEFAK